MIKKWVEYIKESFERLTHTEEDVLEYTRELVDVEIDNIFIDVHQEFNTSSGDITPEQTVWLDKLKEDLSKLITDQVTANIELKNQKSDNIDLEELSQLEDEREQVREGDEVIAVYTEKSYIKNVYKFTVEKGKALGNRGTLGYFNRVKIPLPNSPLDSEGNAKHVEDRSKWYGLSDADLVVKVDTYNDFVSGDKKL
jgi:hypothetical protein